VNGPSSRVPFDGLGIDASTRTARTLRSRAER
jgi:hypothetical protein